MEKEKKQYIYIYIAYLGKEKKQLGIIEKLSKGITLDKILPYKISSMKVYAFVGPSRNREKL